MFYIQYYIFQQAQEEARGQSADYYGSSYGMGDYGMSDYDGHNYGHGAPTFSVDNTGRLNFNEHNLLNKYWANMHRQWGHRRETKHNADGQARTNLVVSNPSRIVELIT